jgi:AcrR family transcriptional regulator
MPKGFTEREKELIRARLLQAAHKQFSAYGLKKTNIEELAQAAKISKGAFYLFYESKEALFMDVVEEVEQRSRREIFAAIDLPAPSSRARLLSVFKTGFALLKTIPMLQFFTGSDYDLLLRRVPAEKVHAHLVSDRLFLEDLVTRCQNAGIAIRVPPDEISGLLYPLALASLHADDLSQNNFGGSLHVLLELVAAFCLGELTVTPQELDRAASGTDAGSRT